MNEIIIFLIWFFILGLCIGSFLNVVILRGLSGESIVFPPSKCPKCGNRLKWWMNIPVFSYVLLRGKCHFCKEKISPQYPIIEAVTAALFLSVLLKFGLSFETLFFIIAASCLVVMSVCDIKESVIIDNHAYVFILSGILYNLSINGFKGLWFALIGALAGFLVYEVLARSGYLFAGQRAFGEGDSLIAAGIGAFFGWQLMFTSIVISVVVMAIFTFPYFFIHSCKTGKKRTCKALIASLLLILGTFIIGKTELIRTFYSALIFLFLLIFALIWIVRQIFADKKDDNGENSFCALPYGPAMAVSFFAIMYGVRF